MTLRTGKGGRYRYYTCSTKARQGETGCPGRTVPMEKLDTLVADHIEQRLLQPKRLEESCRVCSAAARSAPSAERRISPNCASERAKQTPTQAALRRDRERRRRSLRPDAEEP